MAVSIKSVERTDQGTINKIRLGNVQPREILTGERSLSFDGSIEDFLLDQPMDIYLGDEKIGRQSFFMNEFISGKMFSTAKNVVPFSEVQEIETRGREWNLRNPSIEEPEPEPEPEPSPGIPEGEEPEDSQREMNPLVIYAIVGILAYVTAR